MKIIVLDIVNMPRSSARLPISFWVVASSSSGTADTVFWPSFRFNTTFEVNAPAFANFTGLRFSLARHKFSNLEPTNQKVRTCCLAHARIQGMFLCVTEIPKRAAVDGYLLPMAKHG